MLKLKTILTPIALCLTLASTSYAFAQKGHGQHNGMRQILSELSLTDTQKQDIKQLLKENRQDNRVFSEDAHSFRAQVRSLIQSSDWDEEAVTAALTEGQTFNQTKALQRATSKNQVFALLTTEQQSELVALIEEKQTSREAMTDAEKGRGKGKKKGNRLKRLDLTDEQSAAVEAIKLASKTSATEAKAKLKTFKQAERSLINSDDFSAENWESLRAEYQSEFISMAMLKAKTRHDIWNVLTTEQQEKAAQMKHKGKKRQQEMQS